jgi:hypothetical protein
VDFIFGARRRPKVLCSVNEVLVEGGQCDSSEPRIDIRSEVLRYLNVPCEPLRVLLDTEGLRTGDARNVAPVRLLNDPLLALSFLDPGHTQSIGIGTGGT